MIRIILGGLFRGNTDSWGCIGWLHDNLSAQVYVGTLDPDSWSQFPIAHKIFKTHVMPVSVFEQTQHRHSSRYIEQWSNLHLAYNHFSGEFADDDIIIKLRNDVVFPPDRLPMQLDCDSIYAPSYEFHNPDPYDTSVLMCDQIVMGCKCIMDQYFKMPIDFVFPNDDLKRDEVENGIERLLRLYMQQKNIPLKTFHLPYFRKVQ